MSEEQATLLQKAQRYIRSARLLLEDGDYASAVSRLYYAMFYCAETVLLSKGLVFSSHRGVIASFGRDFVKTGLLPAELHAWLLEAFGRRQMGDYEALPVLRQEDVEIMLEQADRFLQAVEQYLGGQAGTAGAGQLETR
jgi:uncharacterized protein (UPF0332 family)